MLRKYSIVIKVRAVDDEDVRFLEIGKKDECILKYRKQIRKGLEKAYKEGREISVGIEDNIVSEIL